MGIQEIVVEGQLGRYRLVSVGDISLCFDLLSVGAKMKTLKELNGEHILKSGGKAFPVPCCPSQCEPGVDHEYQMENGMDLRDWMAGMALSALLVNPEQHIMSLRKEWEEKAFKEGGKSQFFSELSYRISDQMMKARKKDFTQSAA
jgi:hypothetical protein